MVLPEELVFDLSVFFKIRSEKRRLDENFYLSVKCFQPQRTKQEYLKENAKIIKEKVRSQHNS